MKTIVIGGSSRGLGLELTREHVQSGNQVFALYRHMSAGLEELFTNNNCTPLPCDMADTKSVQKACQKILEITQEISQVYCVAGIMPENVNGQSFESMDLDSFETCYNINALGALRLIQALYTGITEKTSVIIISSESGSISLTLERPFINLPYHMSKVALNMAGCVLKNWSSEKGFSVNLIHPGCMKTDMGGHWGTVEVEESAKGILKIAEEKTAPLFVDYNGNALPW